MGNSELKPCPAKPMTAEEKPLEPPLPSPASSMDPALGSSSQTSRSTSSSSSSSLSTDDEHSGQKSMSDIDKGKPDKHVICLDSDNSQEKDEKVKERHAKQRKKKPPHCKPAVAPHLTSGGNEEPCLTSGGYEDQDDIITPINILFIGPRGWQLLILVTPTNILFIDRGWQLLIPYED